MSKQQRSARRRARREAEARAAAARQQRTRIAGAAVAAVVVFGAGGYLLGTAGADDATEPASAATEAAGAQQTQEAVELSPAETSQLLADPPADLQVLDIRTPEELAEGTIVADPVNIDFYRDDFSAQLAELDRDKPYLVYCRSGNRSGQAVDIMEDLGFTQVYDLSGGIAAWANEGFEIRR